MDSFRLATRLTSWCLAGIATAALAAGGGVAQKCRDDARFLCAKITVTNDSVSVDPDLMTASSSVVQVIWTLPEGYVFAPYGDGVTDGVTFKQSQVQFDRGERIDADGHPASPAKTRFRWMVKKWQGPNLAFPYSISFHEQNGSSLGRQFVCDPTIVNSSALTARRRHLGRASADVALKCTVN